MPKISVIISSYNHADFIGQTIESVLNQTFQDFEIIISDDASTDHTDQVIQPYLTDPRIKYFAFKENRIGHMKNNCLHHATGEYIAVLNSDDLFHPKKLEEQINILEQQKNVGAVFTGVEWINEAGKTIRRTDTIFKTQNRSRHEWLQYFLIHGNCLCHSSVLMRRAVLNETGFYNRWMAQISDMDLWIRICLYADLYILPETYTCNRLMAGERNASGARPETYNRTMFEFYHTVEHYYSEIALLQLSLIFPDVPEFKRQNKNELTYFLCKHLITFEIIAVRSYALNRLYQLYRDPVVFQELTESLGNKLFTDYYKTTAKTSVMPPPPDAFQTMEVTWTIEGEEILKDNVNYSGETLQEFFFRCPKVDTSKKIKLWIVPGKAPRRIHLKTLSITLNQEQELVDLLPEIKKGNAHLVLDTIEPGIKVISLDTNFLLTVDLDPSKINTPGLFLKIAFSSAFQFEYNDFKVDQNLEYISAKRLLSSLVKKLLNRIRSLI